MSSHLRFSQRTKLCVALLLLLALGISPLALAQESTVVAKIDGVALSQADLEAFLSDQLEQLALQKAKLLEEGLGPFVENALLERGAEAQGVPLDAYLKIEMEKHTTPVTDEAVDAWYEANKARLQGQPKEALEPQIKNYLTQTQAGEQRSKLLADLRKQHKVEILLEPVRVTLDDVGATIKGNPEAPVTIVEFSDFQCPACKGFNPTVTELLENYGDKIRVVFRQLPLRSIHPQAQKAAEASLCARDQGKFWELHDAMFASQRTLDVDALKGMAAAAGASSESFDQCLDSGKYADVVQSDVTLASKHGLNGTPSVFINGRIIAPGRVPSYGAMVQVIEDELLRNSGK